MKGDKTVGYYVAVIGKTEEGKDKYCIHPLRWTTYLPDAHKWANRNDAETDVRNMEKIYGVTAEVLKVVDVDEQD